MPDGEELVRASYLSQQGRALDRGARTLAAIAAFDEATDLNPADTWSWILLGRLHFRASDLIEAEAAALKARAAAEQAGHKRDIAVSDHELGEVRAAQGDLDGALEAHQASLEIRVKLAARDPGNTRWQRDLIVLHWRLAELASQQEQQDQERRHWEQALAIANELDKTGRLAPRDAYMPRTIEERLAPLIQPAAGN